MRPLLPLPEFKHRLWVAALSLATFAAMGRIAFFFLVDRPNAYSDCLVDHRSGYHLTSERGPVRDGCRRNLNPFSSWVDP